MRTIFASLVAVIIFAAGSAQAQQSGASANVGPVGAGASVGSGGVGVGAHVGTLGANVGIGVHPYHRVCHGGWYWYEHRHYCRRW